MINRERREKILEILQNSTEPITGLKLSRLLNVTRQIIVGDIAILRSAGQPIISSSRGYLLQNIMGQKGCARCIACKGKNLDSKELLDEMYAVVDNGGTISGMNLKSSIYGELQIKMEIHCRRDAQQYLEQVGQTGFPFITVVTGGLHSLYVQTRNEEELRAIKKCLEGLGLLDENCEMEQLPTVGRYRGMSK